MARQLEKATISILGGGGSSEEPIEVLFNPAEYTHEISNNYKEERVPGLGAPVMKFVNGEPQTLSMELFFDTWTSGGGDVSVHTQRFARIMAIDRDLHAPPPVQFTWGSFSFTAVIVSLSQRFTMFDGDGTPVRATLNVNFKQYRPLSEDLRDPPRNSADKTKQRVLTADDSLWAMAAREYGQPREWRRIARANRIANPRLLETGMALRIPPLDEDDESPGT